MRNKIFIGIGILLLIGLLYWLYKRYLYFPHARVVSSSPGWFEWDNGLISVSSTIESVGNKTGSYGLGYDYKIKKLPNNQIQFIVNKDGKKVVDNIIDLYNPPRYLTK